MANSSVTPGWPCPSPIQPPAIRRRVTRVGPASSAPPISKVPLPTTFRRPGARSASSSTIPSSTVAASTPGPASWEAARWRSTPCRASMPRTRAGTIYTKLPEAPVPDRRPGPRRIWCRMSLTTRKRPSTDAFKSWRDGGPACSGRFDEKGAWKPKLNTRTTRFDQAGKPIIGVEQVFDTRVFEGNVWGLQWFNNEISPAGLFPQYYKHVGEERVAVPARTCRRKPGCVTQEFKLAGIGVPYTSPATGAWTRPGPKRGPLTTKLVDGSVVTYWWYRFVDQPSFQQYSWSSEKKEKLQTLRRKAPRELAHRSRLHGPAHARSAGRARSGPDRHAAPGSGSRVCSHRHASGRTVT